MHVVSTRLQHVKISSVEKHGIKNIQGTSQKVKELSRLLIQLKKTIKPSKFDVVIEAVKILCNFETKDGQQDVRTPLLALMIGHSFKKNVSTWFVDKFCGKRTKMAKKTQIASKSF